MLNKGNYYACLFTEQSGKIEKVATKKVKLNGDERIVSFMAGLCKEMAEENLHIKVKDPGIWQCFIGDGKASSFRKIGNITDKNGSCIIDFETTESNDVDFGKTPPVFDEDGKIYISHLGIELYPIGYVIGTGSDVYGLLGTRSDGYVVSLSSRNGKSRLKSGNRSSTKIFGSYADVLKFLQKYTFELKWFAGNRNMSFSIESASREAEEIFEKEEKPSVSDRKIKKEEENCKLCEEVLQIINNGTRTEVKAPIVLGTDEKEEAVLRMKEFGILGNVINHFKSGHLMQSEMAGILYDLDENAKKAVEITSEYGTPYHVIKSGSLYSVLYVSRHKEEWESDRYDPADPYVYANVYNADGEFDEIGLIGVKPANGGLIRTA